MEKRIHHLLKLEQLSNCYRPVGTLTKLHGRPYFSLRCCAKAQTPRVSVA